MTKKINKSKTWVLSVISIVIALSWILTQVYYYRPKLNRLDDIYHNFNVIQDYYKVVSIATAIPLPSPLGPIEHLNYEPIVAYKLIPTNTVVDFRGTSYGYILKLSTGLNTYLATNDLESSSRKTVLYTIGQLEENRLRLRWFIYNGPLPPPEWIQN